MPDPAATSNAELMSCCAGPVPAEDALLEALRQGDQRAFEVTFHTYKVLVYNLSYRILLNREDALDVSQEVFLTLFRKIAGFRGESSLKSWLFRVTYNKSLNKRRWWRRRGQAQTESLTLLHMERIAGNSSERPDSRCMEQEVDTLVRSAMQRLPVVQRAAVLLRDLEGCSYEDIARITGASLGTVKSRIARARTAMRLDLADCLSGERP